MKTKNLFVAGLAAMAFLSCSRENPVDTSKDDVSLALSISTKTLSKALEPAAKLDLDIKTMIIELYDVNKTNIETKSLTAEEIAKVVNQSADLTDASRIIIEGVSKEAVYAKIYAYQANNASAADLSNGVNEFQNGLEAVPFFPNADSPEFDPATNLIKITKDATTGAGDHATHKIWTIEANMSAYLARYEVKGAVTAEALTPIAGGTAAAWATINVTGVYINNIKDKVDSANPTLIKGNNADFGAGDWATGHPFHTDGNWSNMFDLSEESHSTDTKLFKDGETNVAAYQVFPQGNVGADGNLVSDAAPHVIVRLKITPNKAIYDAEPYYAFITLKKFQIVATESADVTGKYLNEVKRGEIYRIDLSSLEALAPGDVDPDPESAAADLYVKVTIAPWTEVFIRPEL